MHACIWTLKHCEIPKNQEADDQARRLSETDLQINPVAESFNANSTSQAHKRLSRVVSSRGSFSSDAGDLVSQRSTLDRRMSGGADWSATWDHQVAHISKYTPGDHTTKVLTTQRIAPITLLQSQSPCIVVTPLLKEALHSSEFGLSLTRFFCR